MSVLAFFLTAGFSFWGITILNVWFLFVGVALYSLVKKKPLGSLVNAMLFATGLCPLATDLLLRYPSAELHGVTFGSFVLTLVVCALCGLYPAGRARAQPECPQGLLPVLCGASDGSDRVFPAGAAV